MTFCAFDRNTVRTSFLGQVRIGFPVLATFFVISGLMPRAQAQQNLTWDVNGATTGVGGTGSWNTTSPLWFNGTTSQPWNNATFDNAVFAGSAGTVTLATPISAHNLTFNVGGYTVAGSTLTFGGLSPVVTTNVGVTTLNSAINGSTGFTKAGTATLALGGSNVGYTGATTVAAGTLRINSANALGVSTSAAGLVLNSGSTLLLGTNFTHNFTLTGGVVNVQSAGTFTWNGSPTLTSSTNLNFNGTLTSVTMSGNLANTGANILSLTKSGTLATILSGSNSYTGTTTITQGKLQAGSAGGLSPGSNLVFNGTTGTGGSLGLTSASGNFTRGLGTGAGQVRWAGDGGFVASGSARVVNLGGAGTTLTWGSGGFVPTGSRLVLGTDSNSTLDFQNGIDLSGGVRAVQGDGGLISGHARMNGLLSGTGGLNHVGNGLLELTASNTYSGGTNLTSGTLIVSSDGNLGAVSGALTFDGGTLLNTNTITTGRSVTINAGGGRFQTNAALFATGLVIGTGNLVKTGAARLVLTGTNRYTGGTTITAGTLQLGNGGTSGGILGNVTNGGTLSFNRSDVATFPGVISGTGGVAQLGIGTTVLTADNSYTGGTTITAGTLQLGNGGTSGGILGNVTNGGTLSFNRSDVATFPGVISGTGRAAQLGTGTTVLTADNTFTGGTTITAGTLQLGNGGTTGSILGNVTNSGTLSFNRSDVVTFNGIVTGAGHVSQKGAGTTVLTADNTYSGGTSVTAGALAVGSATSPSAALSGGGALAVAAGATLGGYGGVTGTITNAGRIAVANALAAFAGGPAGNFTIDGNLTNAGLVQIGGGSVGNTLTVTGNYVGQGGVIALNTALGTDGSAGDRLVIDSGTATGMSGIGVTNAGGLGARTVGTGILVVAAVNGGTTAASAFSLSAPVAAGAYEYNLFRGSQGSSDSWYLRSEAPPIPPIPPTPPVPPDPPLPPRPPAPPVPPNPPAPPTPPVPSVAYRPVVPLLSALPNLAREMGMATLGTWHERISGDDLSRLGLGQPIIASQIGDDGTNMASGLWGRAFGQRSWTTQRGVVRPETDAAIGGFQIGIDLWQHDWSDGARTRSGVFGAYTYGEGDVSGYASGIFNRAVGTLTTDATTFGGYVTHVGASGWYVDGVTQRSWLGSRARTLDVLSDPSTEGRLWTVSLEAGVPFRLSDHWAIEPQVQLIYQRLDWDHTSITHAFVKLDADDGWTGRVGARLQGSWQDEGGTMWQPYLLANLWHRFVGTDLASFNTAAAINVVPTKFGGTSLQLGGGAKVQIGRNVELFGQASYALPIGRSNDGRHALKGDLGLTLRW
ncbi:autotransporter outer membrane beta-barrel domain-containing protein [Microvirga antarctica]|uniref:autotransporter outer membrane beta-barrel domain-containing protein n=1 Tax=Microvirga antarctica TaxID=2819233 RepID=UPI001B30EC34|nr:autotransporter outer membrane beta-barrel domain-containing protein [Microvirga antarctica]